ncbi:PilZ domain-containing protein [Roseibium salinum]|nr:PilZ domain-containing protein [Roseibium salinum]
MFAKSDKTLVFNKRNERRRDVSIPVKLADPEGLTEITGTIIDAGYKGCRVSAKGLTALPDDVVLTIKTFDRPVLAEFAWRTDTTAGLRLLWDRSLGEQDDEALADAAFEAAERAEGA